MNWEVWIMKSRTSFCNAALLKKDILRFAPLWSIYLVFLLMLLLIMAGDSQYHFIRCVGDSMQLMAVFNLGYAFLCVQLLFGDLYNSRMCNTLHALPVRRESWFGTHVTAALLFALIPYALCAAIGTLFLGQFWQVGLWWLAASVCQFVCFLGIGVVSALWAGNRFAMLVIYGLINFFAAIVYWMALSMYQPLLFGIQLDLRWVVWLVPVAAMVGKIDYLTIDRLYGEMIKDYEILDIAAGDNRYWSILYALVGLALLWVGLVLYRRRRLEAAGDFLENKALEPVFLVVFALSAGNACQIFWDIFGIYSSYYFFLIVGVVIGFFAGQMLLMRTTRVFGKQSWRGLLALGAALVLSLVVTRLDPLGLTRWVPDGEDVQSIMVYDADYASGYAERFTVTEPEDIAAILDIHQTAIDARITNPHKDDSPDLPDTPGDYMHLTLCYQLKNGRTVNRDYYIHTLEPAGKVLQGYFSTPQSVLGIGDLSVEEFVDRLSYINVADVYFPDTQSMCELVEALIADCENGTMAQPWDYHDQEYTAYYLYFQYKDGQGHGDVYCYEDVRVYPSNENAYAWLQAHQVMTEQERYG